MNMSQETTSDQGARTRSEKQPGKTILIGAIICLCLVAGGFFVLHNFSQKTSPQQDIQALLEERATALSQKDLERYLHCFSSQYQDGEQGYQDLKASASRWFTQFENIQFAFQMLHLEIDGTQALVENNYKFSLRPPDGEILNISNKELLELRRENTGWKIFKNLKPQ
jgi:ketosteroid isomerase-like protein